ncbi:MAG: toll/interleukin-1 receptor domain-containing protein [Pirellulaceae bacterium]
MQTEASTTERPSRQAGFARHVFISYSHRDRVWVREYLIPQLEASELLFEIDEDFDLGHLAAENMTQAVAACEHTLIVFTRNWFHSDWSNFEGQLALDKDPSGRQRSVILLRKDPEQDIPYLFRARTYLDISDFDTRDEQMAKMLAQLGASKQGIAKARATVAKKSLDALRELIADPSVAEAVSSSREKLTQIKRRFGVITQNKAIHDCLQTAELAIEELARLADCYGVDESSWSRARPYVKLLRRSKPTVERFRANNSADALSTGWLRPLCEAVEQLTEAVDAQQEMPARYASEQLLNQLRRILPLVNSRVVETINELPLTGLWESLKSIQQRLERHQFAGRAFELFEQFRTGIQPLLEMSTMVRDLVVKHNILQQIDTILVGIGGSRLVPLMKVEFQWRFLRSSVSEQDLLHLESPRLCKLAARIDEQLRDTKTVHDEAFEANLNEDLFSFLDEAKQTFHKIDTDLLSFCDDLDKFSGELNSIIERMQEQ